MCVSHKRICLRRVINRDFATEKNGGGRSGADAASPDLSPLRPAPRALRVPTQTSEPRSAPPTHSQVAFDSLAAPRSTSERRVLGVQNVNVESCSVHPGDWYLSVYMERKTNGRPTAPRRHRRERFVGRAVCRRAVQGGCGARRCRGAAGRTEREAARRRRRRRPPRSMRGHAPLMEGAGRLLGAGGTEGRAVRSPRSFDGAPRTGRGGVRPYGGIAGKVALQGSALSVRVWSVDSAGSLAGLAG